jgi:hypothetical protein
MRHSDFWHTVNLRLFILFICLCISNKRRYVHNVQTCVTINSQQPVLAKRKLFSTSLLILLVKTGNSGCLPIFYINVANLRNFSPLSQWYFEVFKMFNVAEKFEEHQVDKDLNIEAPKKLLQVTTGTLQNF